MVRFEDRGQDPLLRSLRSSSSSSSCWWSSLSLSSVDSIVFHFALSSPGSMLSVYVRTSSRGREEWTSCEEAVDTVDTLILSSPSHGPSRDVSDREAENDFFTVTFADSTVSFSTEDDETSDDDVDTSQDRLYALLGKIDALAVLWNELGQEDETAEFVTALETFSSRCAATAEVSFDLLPSPPHPHPHHPLHHPLFPPFVIPIYPVPYPSHAWW